MTNARGLSLISILLAVAILGVLYAAVMKLYFNGSAAVNSGERKALAEQGIKTDDLSGFTRQARDTVEKANAAAQQNVEEAEKQATGE